jgi:predicted O-methyltransferase YrrM
MHHDSFLGFLCVRAVGTGYSASKDRTILKRLPDVHGAYRYCEVGVYKGYSTAILGQQRNNMTIIGIDPWKNIASKEYIDTGDDLAKITNAEHEQNYQEALQHNWFLLSQNRISFLRETSTSASFKFTDNFFDMVFIDADHSYEGCKQDIEHWYPKVKPGGWLAGHDYKHPGYNFQVHLAVDEFVAKHQLQLELDEDYTWFVRKPN